MLKRLSQPSCGTYSTCLCCAAAAAAAALADENALAATLQVASAYDELMLAYKKEVHCNIITSQVRTCLGVSGPSAQCCHRAAPLILRGRER